MARAATSTDVFNAIAEPKRREIISELEGGKEHSVNEIAEKLGMRQPAVSKHLGVLRKVGVVSMSKDGRHRMYRLDARKLKPVHDWAATFEKFWTDHLDRIKEVAERLEREQTKDKK